MKINSEVLNILNQSTVQVQNNFSILYLPNEQLDRKLYLNVNKVLELLGGKWNRKEKGHVFDENIEDKLNDAVNFSEIVDRKKEYQFFRTPKNIIKQMIELSELKPYDYVLEPSAGDGAIADELSKLLSTEVSVIELNTEKYLKLEKRYRLSVQDDFLQVETSPVYDKIIMNPPFSKQQDIDHILHAFKCLKKNGILVSIVSESPFFRNNTKSKNFRDWLKENNAEIIDLMPGAFKESGTMVKTRILKILNS